MRRDWHRVFGVTLADVVTGLPFRVVQELELSRMKQRLDVAIIYLTEEQVVEHSWPDLPDGLTDLAEHNLVTYKSLRESLTCGSMWELVSHAVIYGKHEWKKGWEAVVQDHTKTKLIAVTTHRPDWLRPGDNPSQRELTEGVFEIEFLKLIIRVIVPREVTQTARNALWHLLSGDPELVRYGMEHYQARDAGLYNILNDLRETYEMEGLEMPYTKEDYKREFAKELFRKISPNERYEVFLLMSPDERREWLDALPPSAWRDVLGTLPPSAWRDVLGTLPPSEGRALLNTLPPNERREWLGELPVEERLSGLSAEQIEAYLNKIRKATPPNDDATGRN
jgi:hypothetical protein